jgi:hypothetical protein
MFFVNEIEGAALANMPPDSPAPEVLDSLVKIAAYCIGHFIVQQNLEPSVVYPGLVQQVLLNLLRPDQIPALYAGGALDDLTEPRQTQIGMVVLNHKPRHCIPAAPLRKAPITVLIYAVASCALLIHADIPKNGIL